MSEIPKYRTIEVNIRTYAKVLTLCSDKNCTMREAVQIYINDLETRANKPPEVKTVEKPVVKTVEKPISRAEYDSIYIRGYIDAADNLIKKEIKDEERAQTLRDWVDSFRHKAGPTLYKMTEGP